MNPTIEKFIRDNPEDIRATLIVIAVINLLIIGLMVMSGNFLAVFFNLLRILVSDVVLSPVVFLIVKFIRPQL